MNGPSNQTNKQRLDAHEGRLAKVEAALDLRVPHEAAKSVIGRKYEWVINHKGTSLVLSIILCIGGGGLFYWLNHKTEWWNSDVDHRVDVVLSENGGVKETLSSIRDTVTRTEATLATLQPFIHDVVTHQFEDTSRLPTATLEKRLPAVRDLLALARSQNIKTSASNVNEIGKRLNAVSVNSAEFWPTAAQFITYRSFNNTSWDIAAANVRTCTDSPPPPPTVASVQDKEHLTLSPAGYENCRFDLDSLEQDQKLNSYLLGKAFMITFKKCLIVYHGGSINLVLSLHNYPFRFSVGGHPEEKGTATVNSDHTLEFNDCLFEFQLQSKPQDLGAELTKYLLAATGPIVRLPIIAPA